MIYLFGDSELDTGRFELRRGGAVLALEPQVFDLLRYLIENRDRLITREELFETIWKGRIVSEATLSSRIKAARQAIGDDGRSQSFIRTTHGRGFRFVAATSVKAAIEAPPPSVEAPPENAGERAREALARGAWEDGFRLLSAADAAGALSAPELELLADAAWWTSRPEERLRCLERAHELYIRQDNRLRAAHMSLLLAEQHGFMLAQSVASGWLHRAERLLEDEASAVEHGYLARYKGRLAFERRSALDLAIELAELAYAIGVRFRDRDLEMIALHDRGVATVAKGEVSAGFALMEEAMAAAMTGELGAMATGRIFCNMLDVCMRLADYRRAAEWDEAAARWCDRVGHSSGFPGVCRIRRAEIRKLRGDWSGAEAEARRACVELEKLHLFCAPAYEVIGELCLWRGEFDAAEQAFRRAHELGRHPLPGLARLRLAEGNMAAATELLREALSGGTLSPLDRARVLPAAVEIHLAANDAGLARAAADELSSLAATYKVAAFEALALWADGLCRLSGGDAQAATEPLGRARELWSENGLPFEEARARLALAGAYRRLGIEEIATLESDAAIAAFQRLGVSAQLQAIRAS
jgi:DNA-binding winged helix-turn-helix (wHTH) protein